MTDKIPGIAFGSPSSAFRTLADSGNQREVSSDYGIVDGNIPFVFLIVDSGETFHHLGVFLYEFLDRLRSFFLWRLARSLSVPRRNLGRRRHCTKAHYSSEADG